MGRAQAVWRTLVDFEADILHQLCGEERRSADRADLSLHIQMEEALNARQKITLFDYNFLYCRFIKVCEKMLFLCDSVTNQFD